MGGGEGRGRPRGFENRRGDLADVIKIQNWNIRVKVYQFYDQSVLLSF